MKDIQVGITSATRIIFRWEGVLDSEDKHIFVLDIFSCVSIACKVPLPLLHISFRF